MAHQLVKIRIVALIAGALIVTCNANADLIVAGWDRAVNPATTNRGSANYSASGITATVVLSSTINGGNNATGDWSSAATGSDDLSFGTFAGAVANNNTAALGSYLSKVGNVYLDYTVVNNGISNYVLNEFHFDAWRKFGGSGTPTATILAGGGLTAGALTIGTIPALGGTVPTSGADYTDIDISLTSLPDYTLAAGESATFRILISGASGGTFIDNVAITGIIPEPATVGLFVISSAVLLLFRKFLQ